MSEEEKIAEMEQKIAELKKKKAEMLTAPPEPPKEEEKEEEKEPEIQEIKKEIEEYTPPDPTDVILKSPEPKKKFEGGLKIDWIDNRYHINGVRGIPNGNRIIVRSLEDVDKLIRHLGYARRMFNQKEMINTKTLK